MKKRFVISDGEGNFFFHNVPDQKVFTTKHIDKATRWASYDEAYKRAPDILPLIGGLLMIEEIYVEE